MYSDEEDEEEGEEEVEDEFPEIPAAAGAGRVVTTVPAKEPRLDALPLKPALKKPGGGAARGGPAQHNGRAQTSTPSQQEKSHNSR